jgi:hypothetical protein
MAANILQLSGTGNNHHCCQVCLRHRKLKGSGDLDFAAWPQVKTIHGRSKKSIRLINGDLARQKGIRRRFPRLWLAIDRSPSRG